MIRYKWYLQEARPNEILTSNHSLSMLSEAYEFQNIFSITLDRIYRGLTEFDQG